MSENKETITVDSTEVTREEIDSIVSGVRPKDMDFELFKKLRKQLKYGIKGYLKGRYFFVASTIAPKEEGSKEFIRHTATYIKPKEETK
jgi:hypothetical protein